MEDLPIGYYAVTSPDEPADTFAFKGVSYRVKQGKNAFTTVHEAAAHAEARPRRRLSGLEQTFAAPVILFSPGSFSIDKLILKKDLVFLGANAFVDPNLPAADGTELPPPEPRRGLGETLLTGSYWFGKMWVEAAADITFDGFSLEMVRLADETAEGGTERLTFRNLIYTGKCGDHIFRFGPIPEASSLYREVRFENLRFVGVSGLDYGKNLILGPAHRMSLDRIVFADTDKMLGFTDIVRRLDNCPANASDCELAVSRSYLRGLCGDRGLSAYCREDAALHFSVEDSVLIDAARPGEPEFCPKLSRGSSFRVKGCRMINSGAEPPAAALIFGRPGRAAFTDCRLEGFGRALAFDSEKAVLRRMKCEDPHTRIAPEEADFGPLEALYAGRKVYYGDLHAHSDCGGKSDGKTPIAEYTREMDKLSIDFTALVDHRQMRGYFLPTWDKERFIYGMEPGTSIPWAVGAEEGYARVHYCMLFPHEYSLCLVFANFPEFKFTGDELTGYCQYPVFTRERFDQLVRYIYSIGGILVHPHPKDLMASSEPLDYYFGEHTYLETISVSAWDNMTYKNYELWIRLLRLGKHVYTSGGADAHGRITNAAVSTFYSREKSGNAFFEIMRSGDFTVGFAGIKMAVGDSPMGSELPYRAGSVLTLEAGDLFPPQCAADHRYVLRVFTDRGLCCREELKAGQPLRLALKLKKRLYYRADVFDATAGYPIAISNPIWLS